LQLKKTPETETKIIDFTDNIFFFFFVKKEKSTYYYYYCELKNESKKSLDEEEYLKGYYLC